MAEHRKRRLEYIACHNAGMTAKEAAEKIGVAVCAVHTFASKNKVKFRDPRNGNGMYRRVPLVEVKVPAFSVSPKAIARYEART